jgi:sporulation protein YabP
MAAEKQLTDSRHGLTIEGRERTVVSGVTDVIGFDEGLVNMETTAGSLTVRGEGLHVEELNLEHGHIILTGTVTALEYSEETGARSGFFGRLFG